jgi:hypothetical protein
MRPKRPLDMPRYVIVGGDGRYFHRMDGPTVVTTEDVRYAADFAPLPLAESYASSLIAVRGWPCSVKPDPRDSRDAQEENRQGAGAQGHNDQAEHLPRP